MHSPLLLVCRDVETGSTRNDPPWWLSRRMTCPRVSCIRPQAA